MKEHILVEKQTISYRVGVDILGFPIYEEHSFNKLLEIEYCTGKCGVNMTKHQKKYRFITLLSRSQTKQF